MNQKICDFCKIEILPTIENYRTFITLDLIEKGRRKKKVGDMCIECYEKLKANDNIALLSTAPKGDVAKPESSRAINGDGNSPDTPQDASRLDNIQEPKLEGSTSNPVVSNLLQKQRQEILEKIDKLPEKDITPRDDGNGLYTEVTDCEYGGFVKVEDLEILKQQLNQPKTEQ